MTAQKNDLKALPGPGLERDRQCGQFDLPAAREAIRACL